MGQTTARLPEEREEQRRVIIPRRAGEAETEELTRQREGAAAAIRQLAQVSRTIVVPSDVRAEIESRQRVVERLRGSGVPFLNDRYNNELDIISGVLRQALTASDEHRSTDANRLLGQATAMMQYLARAYPREIGIVIHGVPPQLENGTQTYNDILDSAEIAILDAGTPNAQNAENVLLALDILYQNASVYNIDDIAIRGERNQLIDFILEHGIRKGTDRETRAAHTYTEAQATRDRQRLERFQAAVTRFAAQMRRDNTARLTEWRDDLATRMAQLAAADSSRQMMESLRQELDAMLLRLGNERTAREVRDEEIGTLENRYLMLTGRPPRMTREQRDEQLSQSATELRGSGSRSDRNAEREGTAEWFGAQALAAMASGNRETAGLAVAMGYLERLASGNQSSARAMLGDERYQAIISLINQRAPVPPVLASQFSTVIEAATLNADAGRLERSYAVRGRGDARERLERINSAVRVARERLDAGDLAGARRLLDMAGQYATYMDAARGRAWTASDEMDAALDLEIGGGNGEQGFSDAMVRNQFGAQVTEFRGSLSSWGRGIAQQRRTVDSALTRVEELVAQGNFREAQVALLRIIMYADSVDKLGIRRGGRIESMNPRFDGSGMERALGAFVRGETQVDGRGAETVFSESYAAAQRTAIDVEADRIAQLATRGRWTVGRETVDQALARARERAAAGDYEGAYRLIRYVQQYYGQPMAAVPASGSTPAQAARSEGWRYWLAASGGTGFTQGRERMLDAIRMEMDAATPERSIASAQMFQQATQRIAECEALRQSYASVYARWMGTAAFVDGQPATMGQLPISYDGSGRPIMLDLALVRNYERDHGTDPALGTFMGLGALFRQLERASREGDLTAYNRIAEQIFGRYDATSRATVGGRFWLVAQRAARMRNIDTMLGQLRDLSTFTSSLPAYEGSEERRRGIDTRRQTLIRNLEAARTTTDELDFRGPGPEALPSIMDNYAYLLSDVDRERRTSLAVSVIDEQRSLNRQYREGVGYPGGDITDVTRQHLDSCDRFLVEARLAAVEGRFEESAGFYQRAIGSRTDALQQYWARNVVTAGDVMTAHRARLGASGPDERVFPLLRIRNDQQELAPYQEAQMLVFNDILFGNTPAGESARAHGERMQRRLQGTVMIECSIFGIPAGSTAQQILADYRGDQRAVRTGVYAAWRREDAAMSTSDAGERASYLQMAQQEFDAAQTTMREMQARAERNRMIAQGFLLAVGIAACFIPYAGIYIGGAIFVGTQVESMVTEYRMRGEVSGESWAMLGITVATLGFAAAGGIVRTVAQGARISAEGFAVAGNLARAEALLASASRYTMLSRAFTGVAVAGGLGMSGYMEYSAYRLYQQAQRTTDQYERESLLRQAMFTAAVGAVPLVLMGAGVGRALLSRPSGRAALALEELVPSRQTTAGEAAEVPLVRRIQSADGLFEFMARLRSTEASVRAAAEAELAALPEAVRVNVGSLASGARVGRTTYLNITRSLQSGELSPFARAELEAFIGRLPVEMPPPEGPPGGPRGGGGPRTTRPEVDSAGLAQPQGLFGFMQDLLIPDGAPQPALNARAAARATLERMRADPRTARVADTIDNLVGNPQRGISGSSVLRAGIEGDITFAELDPFTLRGIQNAARQIEPMVRPQVMRAVVNGPTYTDAVGTAAETAGQPAEAGLGGAVPVRAMAEPGSGGSGRPPAPGPEVAPGRVSGPGEAGGAGRGGAGSGPRAPRGTAPRAQGEQPAAPAQGEAPQINVTLQQPAPRPGRVARAWGWMGRRATGTRTRVGRWWRGEAALERVAVLDEATDAHVAQRLDAMANEPRPLTVQEGVITGPQRIVSIMRGIWERAMSPETRVTTRNQCMEILESLYRHPEVRRLIAQDPALAEMHARILSGADANISAQGIRGASEAARREVYFSSLPELTSLQRGIIVDLLEAQGTARGMAPLANATETLGLELSSAQRVNMLRDMVQSGRVQQGVLVNEMAMARGTATEALGQVPTEANAIADAMRLGLLRRLRTTPGSSFDAMVLEVLRSPETAAAVERAHGRAARVRFEAAIRGEGTLAEIMDRLPPQMRQQPEGGVAMPETAVARMARDMEAVSGYVQRLRGAPQLADSFYTMETLGPRVTEILANSRAQGSARATAGRPFGVGQWSGRQARRAGRVLYHVEPSWSTRTGIAEFVGEAHAGGWRAGLRNSLFTSRTLWRIGHAAGWGVGLYYGLPALRDWYTGAADIRTGNRLANEMFGMNVSEANARWLAGPSGERFGRSLVVGDTQLQPRDADDLRAMMLGDARGEIWLDRSRVNDVLTDGRAMESAMPDLNSRLAAAIGPEGESRTAARTELGERLGRLGITAEDVRSALIRQRERSQNRALNATELAQVQATEVPEMLAEFLRLRGNRTQLALGDLAALRLPDWQRRGIAIDSRRAVVQTYLNLAGLRGDALSGAVSFFSTRENADAFVFLWSAARAGHMPVTYIDNFINYLMASETPGGPTNMAQMVRQSDRPARALATELRSMYTDMPAEYLQRVDALERSASGTGAEAEAARRELGGLLLGELLRRRAMSQGVYLEIMEPDGTTRGIRPNSFLQAMDERAQLVADYRQPFESMLSGYRANVGAMSALNSFVIRDNEDIFGDPSQLASRIAAAGGTVTTGQGPRPLVAEANRLLTEAAGADAAARQAAEIQLQTLLAPLGITLASVRTRLTVAGRQQILLEDLTGQIADNARAEGIIGPSVLVTPTDRSMLGAADGPALVLFAARYSNAQGGLMRWLTENRNSITNMHEILLYIMQNSPGGFRNPLDASAFADRNAAIFRQNGWFARAQTPGELAAQRRRETPQPPARGTAPAATVAVPEYAGITAIEMVPQRTRPAEGGTPAAVRLELTGEQRTQATAFYASERGQQLGLLLDGILMGMYNDTAGDGVHLRAQFGEPITDADNNPAPPEAARTAIREEIFRILISTRPPDVTMRGQWGITISGSGDAMRITINMGTARTPLQNRIRQYVMEQERRRQPAGDAGTR